MKPLSTFFGMIFGITALSGLLAGAYFLFTYVKRLFAILNPQVEVLTGVASVVAMICAVIIAEGLKARDQRESPALTSPEKAKVYERILSLWTDQLNRWANGEVFEEDQELVKLEQVMTLHGGEKVITAYFTDLRRAKQDTSGDEARELLSKLLIEMRNDLGRTEFKRKEGVLLNLLLGRN